MDELDIDKCSNEQLLANLTYLTSRVEAFTSALSTRIHNATANVEELLAPLDVHLQEIQQIRANILIEQVRQTIDGHSNMLALRVTANGEGGINVTGYIDNEGSTIDDPRWGNIFDPTIDEDTNIGTVSMWSQVDKLISHLPASSETCPEMVAAGIDTWVIPLDRRRP